MMVRNSSELNMIPTAKFEEQPTFKLDKDTLMPASSPLQRDTSAPNRPSIETLLAKQNKEEKKEDGGKGPFANIKQKVNDIIKENQLQESVEVIPSF
mmetsp:Transcript_22075/g.21265  ORF Transcript_22075/g.21265 Transcript_22075/m.21265 type:complete len:97 (+) Transcript_22075:573-863(+)